MTSKKPISLVVEMFWNNEPDDKMEKECYIGTYDEKDPDTDAFFWFETAEGIVCDHGDFTVTRVVSYDGTSVLGRGDVLEKVFEQITQDVYMSDFSSIEELLSEVNIKKLNDYLPEKKFGIKFIKTHLNLSDAADSGLKQVINAHAGAKHNN